MTLPFDIGLWGAVWMAAAVLIAALVRGYSGFGYSAMVIAASSLVTNPLNFVAVVVIAEAAMSIGGALAGCWRGRLLACLQGFGRCHSYPKTGRGRWCRSMC
jgi:hypothetical protein